MNYNEIIESAENSVEFYDTLDAVAEDYNAGKMLNRIYKEIDDDWDEEGADTEWLTEDDDDFDCADDDDEWLDDDEIIDTATGDRFK